MAHLVRYPFGVQQCLLPPELWFVRLQAPDRNSHFLLFDTKHNNHNNEKEKEKKGKKALPPTQSY